MKRILAAVFISLLAVAMTLVAVVVLVDAAIQVAQLQQPLIRAAAVTAVLVLGVCLLLGTIYLATHLAVMVFRNSTPRPRG